MSTASHLYCFGGRDETKARLSSGSHLNPLIRQWESTPAMPTIKAHFGGAVYGSKIYLVGGNTGSGILDSLEVFDCLTSTWSTLTPMPEARRECAAAVLGDHLYVAGGRDQAGDAMVSVIRYDFKGDSWEPISGLQNARSEHQLVELNGKLYAIRGFSEKTVEEYDPESNQWSLAPNTNNHHFNFGAVVHGGKLYVCSDSGFEQYDPETRSWNLLEPLNNLGGRTLVSFNGKLRALGGGNPGEGGSKAVFEYDFRSGKWSELPEMDTARRHHCSFVVDF